MTLNKQTQTTRHRMVAATVPNCATTYSVIGDPSDPSNTQEAELENEAEQENEAEINQVAMQDRNVKAIAVICANTAVNFANVEQDNDAEQANANNQTQNGGSNGLTVLTTTSN